MIIFDHKRYYDSLLKNGFAKIPNKRDLMVLAREWKHNDKLSFLEIKQNLIAFCLKNNPKFSFAEYENTIIDVCNEVCKETEWQASPRLITFSHKELGMLISIENNLQQKLLFAIMCIVKFKNGNYFFLNSNSSLNLSFLFELANVKVSKIEQKMMIYELCHNNFLSVDARLKYEVLCLDENCLNDVAIQFYSSDNMVLYLEKYKGNKLVSFCENCGIIYKKSGKNQKYCKICSEIMKNESIKQLKQSYRDSKKETFWK